MQGLCGPHFSGILKKTEHFELPSVFTQRTIQVVMNALPLCSLLDLGISRKPLYNAGVTIAVNTLSSPVSTAITAILVFLLFFAFTQSPAVLVLCIATLKARHIKIQYNTLLKIKNMTKTEYTLLKNNNN